MPGNGGFDYIVFESSSDRLYISHGTEVDVLDANFGKMLGKVEDTPGVHGIAIVPDLHRGFTTNGGEATISVFDTDSFKTLKKISVAKDPDFTFYDPHTNLSAAEMEPMAAASGKRPRMRPKPGSFTVLVVEKQ